MCHNLMAGLTLQQDVLMDIVRTIPHDAGAFVVYLLVGAFLAFIWHGSRQKPLP